MLNVRVICLGKLQEPFWQAAVGEYQKRLGGLCSEAQIQGALEREARLILPKLKGAVYPLCIEGRQLDSPGMADLLEKAMQSPGAVSFVVGSSHGLGEQVKAAGQGISMSKMTFPHQLARVMLCEQIYRGFQILRGSPYHK